MSTPQPSALIFSRDQVRQVDQRAISEFNIPGIVLMENAARGLALQAMQMLGWPHRPMTGSVLIITGPGNNGGDGFAAARHLHNHGVQCTLILLKSPDSYKGDALTNLQIAQAMNLNIIVAPEDPITALSNLEPNTLIIDCIFGTGLNAPPAAPYDQVVNFINAQPALVLACDIPSGLDCDTGKPLGEAVRADATATFVGFKQGFTNSQSREYTGQIIVTDIGAPARLVKELGWEAPRS